MRLQCGDEVFEGNRHGPYGPDYRRCRNDAGYRLALRKREAIYLCWTHARPHMISPELTKLTKEETIALAVSA